MRFFNDNHVRDFSGCSNDELLDCFKTREWEKLGLDSKVAVVQELENRSAAAQGREAASVYPFKSERLYGQYTDTRNIIHLNFSNVSSYNVLYSYFHESTHAYQTFCVQTGRGYDEHTLSMFAVECARDRRGNLYNYDGKTEMYGLQCVELDSNNTALRAILSQSARYSGDPEFVRCIDERLEEYRCNFDVLDSDRGARVRMQNKQACNSFLRDDITSEQLALLIRDNNEQGYEDATIAEARWVYAAACEQNRSLKSEREAGDEYLGRLDEVENLYDAGAEYLPGPDGRQEPDGGARETGMDESEGYEGI